MRKSARPLLSRIAIASGVILMASALLLLLTQRQANQKALVLNTEAAAFLQSVLPERSAGFREEAANPNMAALEYNGVDYIALLEAPAYSVMLPVRAEYSAADVRKAPCRFTGSALEGTLVLAGTDAEGQFDFVPYVDIGSEICLTDMKGRLFTYTVKSVLHKKAISKESLQDESCDLTLYARSRKTHDYILVRCVLP